jgi:hypothetical protein
MTAEEPTTDKKRDKLPYLVDEVLASMIKGGYIPKDFAFEDISDINAKVYSHIMNINCPHCKKMLRIDPRERDSINAIFNFILGYSTKKYGHKK